MSTIETFIAGIAAEPQPVLGNTTGTLLFEVRDHDATNLWLVDVDKGTVGITPVEGAVEADATIRSDRRLADAIAEGRANAMAAVLRGDLSVEGDAELLVTFQRIFPGPPDSNVRTQP